ncbi:MAG: hypothetical protein ACHBN1_35550 [Heteroscytonema crispum UTEX LB 1556]
MACLLSEKTNIYQVFVGFRIRYNATKAHSPDRKGAVAQQPTLLKFVSFS